MVHLFSKCVYFYKYNADFPNLEEGLLQDYQELVEYLREYDVSQAEKYTRRIYRG